MAAQPESRALRKYLEREAAEKASTDEMDAAFKDFMTDCKYIVTKDGKVMDTTYFSTIVAYHMIRCGWRRSGEPVIKARRVDAPGVVEDAIEWVGVDEPDDPLEGIESWSFAQVAALPEYFRRIAIHRLGGNVETDDDLPEMQEPAWRVTPNISYVGEPPSRDEFIPTKGDD